MLRLWCMLGLMEYDDHDYWRLLKGYWRLLAVMDGYFMAIDDYWQLFTLIYVNLREFTFIDDYWQLLTVIAGG